MRRGTLSLLALALTGAFLPPVQGSDLVDLARAARPAVVRLRVQDGVGRDLGTGTGFFTGKDGRIITNFHVVEGADRVVADTSDGRNIPILGLLAKDEKNDIAILESGVPQEPESTLTLAGTAAPAIQPGDRIFVIGAPVGLSGTLSEGIVSALRPSRDMDKFSPGDAAGREDLLQITAAISPGSSGSPVINTSGAVIGVAVSYLGGGQNLNFAVPSAVVQKLLAGITAETKPAPFRNKRPLVNIIISVVFFVVILIGFRYVMRRL